VILIILLTIFMTSPFVVSGFLNDNDGFALTQEMLQHPELAFVELIDHFAGLVGSRRFYPTITFGTVAFVVASIFFSIRLFERRDF
jgi:peptidoglycan biosynthesis protein MviN/MurJ (putative lipid II flippase)